MGESVSNSIYKILNYLNIAEVINKNNSLQTQGYSSYWGGKFKERHQIFNYNNATLTLNRYKFNYNLIEVLKNFFKPQLLFPYQLMDINWKDNIWELTIFNKKNDKKELIYTPNIIDASGRRGGFARKAGAINKNYDHLVGLVKFYDIVSNVYVANQVITEPVHNGWWYMNFLPNNQVVINFMTDPQELNKEQIYHEEVWNNKIQQTYLLKPYLPFLKPLSTKIKVHSAKSRYFINPATSKCIATGDAACSFDPLSSAGIGHGLISGIQAAFVLQNKEYDSYNKDVKNIFFSYLENRRNIYSQEQRWLNEPFWKLRG